MTVYHIKSLKWTNHSATNPDGETVWWGPNSNGYTRDITEAGIYTEKEIQDHVKHHGTNTSAVILIDASVWEEERIKAYKTIRDEEIKQIEKWKWELEEIEERVKSINWLIEHNRESVKKIDMELAIQEKLKIELQEDK